MKQSALTHLVNVSPCSLKLASVWHGHSEREELKKTAARETSIEGADPTHKEESQQQQAPRHDCGAAPGRHNRACVSDRRGRVLPGFHTKAYWSGSIGIIW